MVFDRRLARLNTVRDCHFVPQSFLSVIVVVFTPRVACTLLHNHSAESMKNFLSSSLNLFGLAWWVEIATEGPNCLYYFGPFESAEIAAAHQAGYIEDLSNEGAYNIVAQVKRCKPKELTILNEPESAIGAVVFS
jgi:hypothetical protein